MPQPLIDQLAPGGALVMPIGEPGAVQKLVKVTRKGVDGFGGRRILARSVSFP